MEMTLKQRLESVINKLGAKARDDWNEAQGQGQVMHQNLIGLSGGSLNAIKLIKAEFQDILEEKPIEPISDEPVEPLHYIDSNNVLFRDTYGRFYFWFHLYTEWHGPYSESIEACKEMRKYAQQLDDGAILESLGLDPEEANDVE